jgi:hypothetical protein
MADDEFWRPNRTPAPLRQPIAGELIWEFVRERDHKRFCCALRDCAEYGIDAQVLASEELIYSHLFTRPMDPTRTPPNWRIWSQEERKSIEEGGE